MRSGFPIEATWLFSVIRSINPNFFIKRIIGLPSETIDIRNNKVTVYNAQHPEGIVLDETYLDAGQQTLGAMRTKLDDNEYFVLGDNRLRSSDSRVWGALNESLITGKAFIRLWPFSKVAKFLKFSINTKYKILACLN